MAQQPMEPLRAFAELGRIKFSETSFDGVFERITEFARGTLPGADEASITLLREHQPETPAATSEVARRLDEAQYDRLAGPCLQAAAEDTTVSVPDTGVEARWPEWATVASAAGIRSSLSIGLPIPEPLAGALNLYSRSKEVFHEEAIDLAQTFVGYAAVALANAHLYDSTATLAEQLRQAMEHRAVIEQAKGIVMSERRCTPEEAFALLTKISQGTNRKVRDVASALVAGVAGTPGRPAGPRSAAPRRNDR
jgi:GAF domain-containing protein